MSVRGIWIGVVVGVVLVLLIGGVDVVCWGSGLVDWVLNSGKAGWLMAGVAAMVLLGVEELRMGDDA